MLLLTCISLLQHIRHFRSHEVFAVLFCFFFCGENWKSAPICRRLSQTLNIVMYRHNMDVAVDVVASFITQTAWSFAKYTIKYYMYVFYITSYTAFHFKNVCYEFAYVLAFIKITRYLSVVFITQKKCFLRFFLLSEIRSLHPPTHIQK